MKSTELFDLLGEIDDKFYREARIPDEQYGVEVVSEHRPFRGFMSIFLPIAACVAIIVAVAVGANFVSRNAGLVGPNDPDSDSSADVTLSSDSGVSSADMNSSTSSEESSVPEDDRKIHLEDYPPIDLATVPDIKGSGLETQMSNYDELLQKATLATLKCGDYELYMLGEDIHIDSSYNANLLYSYFMQLAVAKDGEVISSDGPHTFSVSMGQGGYKLYAFDLTNYLEYYELNGANLVIFKYHSPNQETLTEYEYECTFFTITDDGELRLLMGDNSGIGGSSIGTTAYLVESYTVDTENNILRDRDAVYKFNCENFGENPYDAPHYTASAVPQNAGYEIDLSEYPQIEISEIPDVGNDPNDTTNALPKAALAEKRVGEYTLSIIGENIRTSLLIQKGDDFEFMADSVRSVISRDGKVLSVTYENGTGVRTLMLSEAETYDLLPDAYEMKDGIVFGLDKKSVQLSGTPTFGTIKNDGMYKFTPPILGYDDRDPFDGTVTAATGKTVLLSEENALIIDGKKYVFDFDKITYSETIEDNELDIGGYKQFDGNAIRTVQPKAILDVKETAGYKIYLLGDNVKKQPAEDFPVVDFTKLYIAVEKNGKIVARVDADNVSPLNGSKISDYIRSFEMKDGMGFVMYYSIDPWGGMDRYAMIYKIENDTITKLKYDMDFAPAPATGSPHYVGGDFKVVFENNAIVDDDGTITIDFNSNTFSRS